MNPSPSSVLLTPMPSRLSALGAGATPLPRAGPSPIEPAASILKAQEALQANAHLPVLATEEELRDALDKINHFIQVAKDEIHFVLHEEYERWVVRIIDTKNNEVLRQIPSEHALALSKALDTLKGLLIREDND